MIPRNGDGVIGYTREVSLLNSWQVPAGISGHDPGIASSLDARLLTPARAVENVACLAAGDPFPARVSRLGVRCQHTHCMVHFIYGTKGMQLAAHGLFDFVSQVVIRRGDNRVFRARNLAFGYNPDAMLRVRNFICPALLLADLNTSEDFVLYEMLYGPDCPRDTTITTTPWRTAWWLRNAPIHRFHSWLALIRSVIEENICP